MLSESDTVLAIVQPAQVSWCGLDLFLHRVTLT